MSLNINENSKIIWTDRFQQTGGKQVQIIHDILLHDRTTQVYFHTSAGQDADPNEVQISDTPISYTPD